MSDESGQAPQGPIARVLDVNGETSRVLDRELPAGTPLYAKQEAPQAPESQLAYFQRQGRLAMALDALLKATAPYAPTLGKTTLADLRAVREEAHAALRAHEERAAPQSGQAPPPAIQNPVAHLSRYRPPFPHVDEESCPAWRDGMCRCKASSDADALLREARGRIARHTCKHRATQLGTGPCETCEFIARVDAYLGQSKTGEGGST